MHQMCDAGNALPLLGGGGRHQRPRSDKQHVCQTSRLHLMQNVGTQHGGRATASRTARVDILRFTVVQHQPAIVMPITENHAFFAQQLV